VLDKNEIINLILEGKTEEAINILSDFYKVKPPKIKIGLPKGKSYALAVYDPFKNIIYFKKEEYMRNPFIVLHEFYHVIRFKMGKHRGTEKLADEFALLFLKDLYKIK
jgi:hypothetical protein